MTMRTKRRGLSVFRAKDSVDLTLGDFMGAPEMSEKAGAAFATALRSGLGAGSVVKVLLRQPDEDGAFSLIHLWYKANYPLVRHTHDVDCLYYVISGSASLGNQTLRAGDGFFVPADAPYTYTAGADGVEVLEIRHGVQSFGMRIPDGAPLQWDQLQDAAVTNRADWERETVSPTFAANHAV